MYDFILQTKLVTLASALVLAGLACALAGSKPRVALRLVVFNFGPAFACAFFVVGGFYDGPKSGLDLFAGFLFEFSVLLAIAKLFQDAFRRVNIPPDAAAERLLRWSLLPQLLAAAPLIAIDGAGIFSDGSRIAYFHESSSARYLAYIGVVTASVQAGLLAQRLSANRTLGATGYAIGLLALAASILSGSKGGFFLWLAATVALIDYRRARIRWGYVSLAIVAIAGALWATTSVISAALGVSKLEFAELAAARFFLNNDARALAIDLGGQSASLSQFATASFRGMANLLGFPSIDPPLGLLLNEKQTGFDTGNGPNASLIALIMYYSASGYALLPSLVACVGVVGLYGVVVTIRRATRHETPKMAVSLIGIVLVHLLSQDFLAFPLGIAATAAALLVLGKRPAVPP